MVEKNVAKLLKEHLPFYNLLSNIEQNELTSKSILAPFKKGQLVANKNSTCTGVLITLEGQFRTYISAPNGREITLFSLLDRDVCMLSASCAFKNITYNINIESEVDSLALIIDSLYFSELSKTNIHVLNFLLNITQDKLSQVLYVLEQTVFFSLEHRISNLLLTQSNLTNSNVLYITHENIANHLGSAREAVSRILKTFESNGIISISRGKIKILDINKL